jgi:hypothetical protein
VIDWLYPNEPYLMSSILKSIGAKQLETEVRFMMSAAVQCGLDPIAAEQILQSRGYCQPSPDPPREISIQEPDVDMVTSRKHLFGVISTMISSEIGPEFIKSTKTTNGDTQVRERVVIGQIRDIMTRMGIEFTEAGSQQSKDFRNVGGIGLDIEVKKTDSSTIYFNDTCPNKNIWYVILFTGKDYKLTPEKNIPPQILYVNGEEFVRDSPWIEDYVREITWLKDKYARGEGKKSLTGIMEVYPRPTFKANISGFLTK